MKNSQKGFIPFLIILIIAMVAISGGTYYYSHHKTETSTSTSTSETNIESLATTSIKTDNSQNPASLYSDYINPENNTPGSKGSKSFNKDIKPGEIISGPKLAYTKNGIKIQTNYFVGTADLEVKQINSNSAFVKEGPYEYYISSSSQCGGCAHAAFNIYYFDFAKATSTLAYSFPLHTYDLNDTDFVISDDWKKITDFEYELKENVANPYDYDNYKKNYQWNATSYCFKEETRMFEECGTKNNVQPPSPRNFSPSRQDF